MTAAGTETTETPLQAFFDSLLGRPDVPAEALHGRADAAAAWDRYQAGEPARTAGEHWLYTQFARGPQQERGAQLGRSQSLAEREADREAEAGA